MGKNVAVFVDVANIFYAAKAAGVDIDYVTLLKTASAGRDLVRAYAYTGLDPDNENQRNFHEFLRRHGYKVVSKDIRKYGDGKVKANLDIELVVDMMKTARNLDIAIVISGDGDFAPAIRAVQEMGVRVEVISFRGNTSSDLIEVADQFTEITQIARVEKDSSRSGRRVAGDDEDLSMTEVPDKQSEGTGVRGGRGRGRGRSRVAEVEPVAAAPRSRSRSRTAATPGEAVAAVTSDGTPLVVLPGEKLSRIAAVPPPAAASDADLDAEDELDEDIEGAAGDETASGDETRRRRRRRGGRGRGRGRARDIEVGEAAPVEAAGPVDEDREAPEPITPPSRRAGFAFGSVWDSQIGMPSGSPSASRGPVGSASIGEDEDLDEPPIPEYLIAERRQRDGGRGQGGGRGGPGRGGARGAYAAALDRERFGGGRGAGASRFAEPPARGGRPDDRSRGGRPDDRSRGNRPPPRPVQRSGSGDEPWSEVPPEIEAMLRAQLGGRGAAPSRPGPIARETLEPRSAAPVESGARVQSEAVPSPSAPAPRRRTTRPAQGADRADASMTQPEAPTESAPKHRTTRKESSGPMAGAADAEVMATPLAEPAPPKRRTTRKVTSSANAEPAATADTAVEPPAPKRRTTRKKADSAHA